MGELMIVILGLSVKTQPSETSLSNQNNQRLDAICYFLKRKIPDCARNNWIRQKNYCISKFDRQISLSLYF